MNFFISSPGRLCNQLLMLYYVYQHDEVNYIYAPWFEQYKDYFKGSDKQVFCDENFFESNKASFKVVGWEDQDVDDIVNPFDVRFDDLCLKKQYEDEVDRIFQQLPLGDLMAVHVRHGDYQEWLNGKLYFTLCKYIETAMNRRKEVGNCSFLFFSDQIIEHVPEGIVVSSLTNNVPPIDLLLMARCNYFIHTWSTFSLLAIRYSKALGRFKGNYVLE